VLKQTQLPQGDKPFQIHDLSAPDIDSSIAETYLPNRVEPQVL